MLRAYESKSLADRFDSHARETWDEYQECVTAFDSQRHPPGSNEELRHRIGRAGMDGFASKEAFEADLLACFQKHEAELARVYDEWMGLIPIRLLVIADTRALFEDEYLVDRMIATVKTLEGLRGGASIPE